MGRLRKGNGVSKKAARNARQGHSDAFHDVAAARPREQVYRADAPHGPDDTWSKVPARGTSERAELAAKIKALRADGITFLEISNRLNINPASVRDLSREE